MIEMHNLEREAARTATRLLPHLEQTFADHLESAAWATFRRRFDAHFPTLFELLLQLYGNRYDFLYHLEQIVIMAANAWLARPADLKALDAEREANPDWFQAQKMMGGVCYVDRYARDLAGLRAKLPYLQTLGLTYLHLMPLFLAPAEESDGGYAVSDYRQVDPQLGTMDDLRALATELRQAGISLCLDFVFNHTSNEHRWALAAQAGDPDAEEYYFLFPDRTMPDAYDRTLREIFPDQHPGSFTYRPDMDKWVWTTFNSFQWDLNYANPAVFREMANEMLFLANVGAEVLRLDALAFTWKRLGTDCENLPEAHLLVRAFNALVRMAAPSLIFKSEAIVHPDEVIKYIRPDECQISYNPLFMALLWNSLATRQTRLLRQSLGHRFQIPSSTAWVNYVRSHDDIGWTFDDGDAGALGMNAHDHRRFLNQFFTGRFPGSFARGLPFQENPRTGDARISGTLASLAGLEEAIQEQDGAKIELAIRRICLLHAMVMSIGGIPLVYLGDELGTLNDYSFRHDPAKIADSRWVHRPAQDWHKVARRDEAGTIEARIHSALHQLIQLRKSTPALAGHSTEFIHLGNEHIFAFIRTNPETPTEPDSANSGRLLVIANFTENVQSVATNELRLYGLSYRFTELITDEQIELGGDDLALDPYQVLWLLPQDEWS